VEVAFPLILRSVVITANDCQAHQRSGACKQSSWLRTWQRRTSIRPASADCLCPRAHGIDGDDTALQRQGRKQFRNRGDRKNALFYRTLNGARVGDLFMSLIHTAELHRIEPLDYLVTLQRHVSTVALDPFAWMPCNHTEALARAEAAAAKDAEAPPD